MLSDGGRRFEIIEVAPSLKKKDAAGWSKLLLERVSSTSSVRLRCLRDWSAHVREQPGRRWTFKEGIMHVDHMSPISYPPAQIEVPKKQIIQPRDIREK